MTMNRLILLTAASLAITAMPAGAAVVFNNLTGVNGATSGGTADITSTDHHGPLGDSFSTGATASTLTDVMLSLEAATPTDGGTLAVDLFSNNPSTNSPMTLISTLATINDSSLTTALANIDVPVGGTINLAAGTRYWIELASTTTSAEWSYTSTNLGIGVASEYNFYSGASSPNASFTPYQMEVTTSAAATSATPEPSAIALSALGFAAFAFMRRRRA